MQESRKGAYSKLTPSGETYEGFKVCFEKTDVHGQEIPTIKSLERAIEAKTDVEHPVGGRVCKIPINYFKGYIAAKSELSKALCRVDKDELHTERLDFNFSQLNDSKAESKLRKCLAHSISRQETFEGTKERILALQEKTFPSTNPSQNSGFREPTANSMELQSEDSEA